MRYTTTIDGIVRSTLMTMGLPIHYYVQFLHYALKFLNQELNIDTLPLIKTVEVKLDSNNELQIPRDFIDLVKIGVRTSNDHKIRMFAQNRELNRNAVARDNKSEGNDERLSALNYGGYFFSNYYNDKGEHKGRMYGYGNDTSGSEYKIVKERNAIKLSAALAKDVTVYMEYVAYHTATTASALDPRAAQAMESYIIYKFKEHNRAINRQEVLMAKDDYYNEYRKLRGRVFGLTKNDILRLMRGEFRQSVKI
jgi:hypothetical protein